MNGMLLAAAFLPGLALELRGNHSFCTAGRKHTLRYSVNQMVGDTLTDLDSIGKEFKAINCDISGSRLEIVFHDEIHSTALWSKFKLGGAYVFGEKRGCPIEGNPGKAFLMRKVHSAQLYGQAVRIYTSPAQYDEIYEDATITYGASEDADCKEASSDEFGCVGVNANDRCDRAAAAVPIYSNEAVSVSCENCFAGLAFDVFFDLQISGFQLKSMRAGFSDIKVNAALEVDMDAQKSWSVGVDKAMHIAGGEGNPVVSFKIGSVPFVFWFDASQRLIGDVEMRSSAKAQAGLQMTYDIGDSYVQWSPEDHWSHVDPSPSVLASPTVSGEVDFAGSASLRLIPELNMHVNQLFSYGLTLDPRMSLEVQGDSDEAKICESTSYDVKLITNSELHLNIPFLNVHEDKTWGPATVWEAKDTLSQACASVNVSSLV